MQKLILTLAILAVLSFSCYYDSEESLYPEGNLGNCDTNNVTYYGSIVSLVDNNCLSCHAGKVAKNKGGDINLQGYKNVFDNKESILGDIKHDGNNHDMPKNTFQLKDCLIQQFQIWINAGALEN
jgi:hypothetical protein